MTEQKFSKLVRDSVAEWYNVTHLKHEIKPEDVYIVWSSKTLQNNKALASTNVPDGMYFEITYNGDKDEAYFDAYSKVANVCIPDVMMSMKGE